LREVKEGDILRTFQKVQNISHLLLYYPSEEECTFTRLWIVIL